MSSKLPGALKRMLSVLPIPGMVIKDTGKIVGASPAASTAALIRERRLADPRLAELADRARIVGGPVFEELELSGSAVGGTPLAVSVRVAPLDRRHVILFVEDRTEAHRLEAVRRDFLANISHELKTPIGAVGLLAEALESAAGDAEQVRRFAGKLVEESGRLARLTQDIIELSRLEASDSAAHAHLCSVDLVVDAACDQNQVAASAKRVELRAGEPSGASVYGDERVLVMAVHNLVSNAVQFSRPGGRIEVSARTVDGLVEIAVTDQGEGIPAEKLERIFERFYRVDKARSRDTGGTGLGLAIVKHAVSTHGGDVRVVSQRGEGSTFTIRLPEADPHLTLNRPIAEAR